MNLLELRQAVFDNTGRTDKASVTDRGLNFGLDEAISRHDFRDLRVEADVDTVAGSDSVALPEDLVNLLEVRLVDSTGEVLDRPLRVRSKVWLVRRFPNASEQSHGKPAWGYEEGLRLHLIPTPDLVYTLRLSYYSKPSLDEDTDEQPIRLLDRVLIAYATSYVFHSIEKHEEAVMWSRRFEGELATVIRTDKRNKATELGPVHDVQPVIEPWKDPFAGHGR